MENTFHNQRTDIDPAYDYLIKHTSEGQQAAKAVWRSKQTQAIFLAVAAGGVFWGTEGKFSAGVIAALLALALAYGMLLLIAGLRPSEYYARQSFKAQERYFSAKHGKYLSARRTILADPEWLELRSTEAIHRWRWRFVDRITTMDDFIYIEVGSCTLIHIPKRDFASEASFREFGRQLDEYREAKKEEPMGAS